MPPPCHNNRWNSGSVPSPSRHLGMQQRQSEKAPHPSRVTFRVRETDNRQTNKIIPIVWTDEKGVCRIM